MHVSYTRIGTIISFLCFLLITVPLCLTAQDKTVQRLDRIHFNGLQRNKLRFLRKIIRNKEGEAINHEKIKNDLKYLNQLSGVVKSYYRIDTVSEKTVLTFDIEEAMTLFPLVNFGGVRDNFWFQLGLTETNLFGRGHQLTAFYQNNDRRNNYNIYYRLPFINGSNWGASFNFLRFASVEPIYFDEGTAFYDYNNTSYSGTIFYQFKANHILEFGVNHFIEDFNRNDRENSESIPGPISVRHPKNLFKIAHQLNEINFDYFYQDGFFNQLRLEAVYNEDTKDWFHLAVNDFLYFRRIRNKGNLAMRLRLGIATNSNTPFAPFVLDSYVNIRGSGNRIDRGTAAAILNLEYRQTFFDQNNFAGQVVGFSDLGTWRAPGASFSDLTNSDNFRHFLGGGIRLIYKKAFNAMIRIDYGADIYNLDQRGFVFGFGQYF